LSEGLLTKKVNDLRGKSPLDNGQKEESLAELVVGAKLEQLEASIEGTVVLFISCLAGISNHRESCTWLARGGFFKQASDKPCKSRLDQYATKLSSCSNRPCLLYASSPAVTATELS
jgi:hypothetical protein